ncbi:MAG TPA: methylated-DNA--[protein]-cysteine S-methyltransferase [Candidatus Competibacteraceae bacterium]|nr:methylated-DNA--[protein]-cysteine S-methyltransferase [Candidatus Competibacteraceae bacterium]
MSDDYTRIEAAIRLLQGRVQEQPDLGWLAQQLHLSPYHLQRLFQRWAGVSPKRFLQFLTVEHAKRLLAESHSVLETSLAVGLSGPSRLHDHFVALEAVTPGEYKQGGAGLTLRYGVHDSPFGPIFLALSERGVCALEFLGGDEPEAALAELARQWPQARLLADASATAAVADRLFAGPPQAPLTVQVRGSNFQIQVWKALLAIPPGQVTSYQELARALGRPGAARAVGQAVAANPVAYLIPCHRVIQAIGLPGGYRWGTPRKQALLAWEAARREGQAVAVQADQAC